MSLWLTPKVREVCNFRALKKTGKTHVKSMQVQPLVPEVKLENQSIIVINVLNDVCTVHF